MFCANHPSLIIFNSSCAPFPGWLCVKMKAQYSADHPKLTTLSDNSWHMLRIWLCLFCPGPIRGQTNLKVTFKSSKLQCH